MNKSVYTGIIKKKKNIFRESHNGIEAQTYFNQNYDVSTHGHFRTNMSRTELIFNRHGIIINKLLSHI